MSNSLSRHAAAVFWLGRYIERADNLARVLDVNETFSRNTEGTHNWHAILHLYDDEPAFLERYEAIDEPGVLTFYTLDRENPGSILSSIRSARENARTLRALISTEMWTQLNIFYNGLIAIEPKEVLPPRLSSFCQRIKEGCQAHYGIAEGTYYRDDSWLFYELGRMIERADQTTRVLDVKYHLLLPSLADIGSPLDISQWNSVLRSVSGYHAFRRIHPRGMTASTVVGFLLFNRNFPRSVMACVSTIDHLLNELRNRHRLPGAASAMEECDELVAALTSWSVDNILARGLHEMLDWIQLRLISVSAELGYSFFGIPRAEQIPPSALDRFEGEETTLIEPAWSAAVAEARRE